MPCWYCMQPLNKTLIILKKRDRHHRARWTITFNESKTVRDECSSPSKRFTRYMTALDGGRHDNSTALFSVWQSYTPSLSMMRANCAAAVPHLKRKAPRRCQDFWAIKLSRDKTNRALRARAVWNAVWQTHHHDARQKAHLLRQNPWRLDVAVSRPAQIDAPLTGANQRRAKQRWDRGLTRHQMMPSNTHEETALAEIPQSQYDEDDIPNLVWTYPQYPWIRPIIPHFSSTYLTGEHNAQPERSQRRKGLDSQQIIQPY